MLTETQEERLRDALGALVQAAPDESRLAMPPPSGGFRRLPVAIAAFVIVLAVFLPLNLIGDGSTPSDAGEEAPSVAAPTVTVTSSVDESAVPLPPFGEPAAISSPPGLVASMQSHGDVLYAATTGITDNVVRSTDGGSTWETILTADPGDSEGLFGVGSRVVSVIEDDTPARDTVAPRSVVTDAPRVLVFDPDTGVTSESVLPRPTDPQMDQIPLDGSVTQCALGGYQSWVLANGVAVGDRILITGQLELVGILDDGSLICDGQVYRNVVWTSDDDGATWQLNDSPPLGTVAWTGDRFVAWTTSDPATTSVLMTSGDGLNWDTAATTPPTPAGSISAGTAIAVRDGMVAAWAGVQAWAEGIPEDMSYTDPVGAVIATSPDAGATWTTAYADRPITGVAIAAEKYLAVATPPSELAGDSQGPSLLLRSDDGVTWTELARLPERTWGEVTFTATAGAVFFKGDESGSIWKIPEQ